MNFREMNVAVFEGKKLPHVFFQPRFEPWYAWHKQFGCMPERYRGMSLPELYDYCHASMRTVHYYTGLDDPVERVIGPAVKVVHTEYVAGKRARVTYRTPAGDLVEEHEKTVDGTWREVGFPVKDREDLLKLRSLFEHVTYTYNLQKLDAGVELIGERGEASFWVPKSPYQALAQQWMKMEDLVYALADCPDVVEDTMRAIDASYDGLYEQIVRARRPRVINFGENIHEQLCSPRYFEEYFLPFFEKRCRQLHGAGIYTHVHVDGYFHNMLKYLRLFPQHGIEALTPVPQGDMTLEEIKEHIGDKILLDGIPAVLFMDTYSRDELMACTEKVVKLFHPRLILGASDEVPEGTGQEAIERVREVGAWCLAHGG